MKLEELVNKNYDKLNQNDLYIWSYIIHHKEECQSISVKELAERCNVSHTTIIRFTKKIGLQGYSELKIYLRWDCEKEDHFNSKEIEASYQDYIKTMDVIMEQDLTPLFEMLEQSEKIYAYGTGVVQKHAAREFKRVMAFAGYLIYSMEGREEMGMVLNYVSEKDVFFLYSLSGNEAFINDFVKRLKVRGVKIVSITQTGNNELARLSDVSIQFFCHPIIKKDKGADLKMVSQFFLINEFLLLKWLEYKQS